MTIHTPALTPAQSEAVEKLSAFLSSPTLNNFFVFSGFAGTGKTFCMREVVRRAGKSAAKFAFTAPTNKAAKELRKITGQASTIYALLGLRIDKSGELKTLVAGKAPPDLSSYTAIFIDEGGMVGKNLYTILEDRAKRHDLKVVFLGDPAQLPPVNEGSSSIWQRPADVALTQVMRHDNQILRLVTEIRDVQSHAIPTITLRNDHDTDQGVWKFTKQGFRESIYNAAMAGIFSDGVRGKVLAWRNSQVEGYNQLIRQAVYGGDARAGFYLPGERIVAAAPCMRGEDLLLATDEEAFVESAVECQHPFDVRYQALELKCRTETGKVVRLLTIHPDSIQNFTNDSEALAHDAKGNGKLWRRFWEHKELFHEIKYAYALTVHRAQGSTYRDVWADSQDILSNHRNRMEAYQCLYVACSRPTTRLFLT